MNSAGDARARESRLMASLPATWQIAWGGCKRSAGARKKPVEALHALWKTCCARTGDGGRCAGDVGVGSALGWTFKARQSEFTESLPIW